MSAIDRDKLAQHLIKIGAFHFNVENPFTYTSGKKGPVYVDMRRLISFPKERDDLCAAAVQILSPIMTDIDVIAGGETAGIPFAAFLAQRTEKPMIYIRKQAKGFGKMAQIEGHLSDAARVLLIEDLCNFGTSSLKFCEVLQQAQMQIEHIFVFFDYALPQTHKMFAEKNLQLHALLTWDDILASAAKHKNFSEETLASVRAYLHNPEEWKAA